MSTIQKGLIISVGVAIFFSLISATVDAQTMRDRSAKKMRAAADQSAKAARVFNEIMDTREKSIPRELLDRAEAVAVFPGVLKGRSEEHTSELQSLAYF